MALPSAYGEESPEALRRRADVLLDEMMLGGVDTASAGPQTGSYTGNGADHGPDHGPDYPIGSGADHWTPAAEVGLEYDGSGHSDYGPNGLSGTNGGGSEFDAPPSARSNAPDANGYHAPPGAQASPPAAGNSPAAPNTGARLISAEQRYAQLAGGQSGAQSGSEPAAEPTRTQTAAELPTPAQPRPQEWRAEPSAAAWPPAGADDPALSGGMYGGMSGSMSGSVQPGANSAVRRQGPSLASTMSVGVRGANRSNLLPRNNEIDATAAQQEINDLLGALGKALPPGNEAAERSRHLLNKAQTLLQSDPTRTAEVDYYLQQVRRIVQRARQTQQWSSLYHRRLNLYLGAWLLLSALIVAAAALYAAPLADWLNQTFDLPDWWMVMQQGPLLLAGAFAGSLGASLSALWHVQRHAGREYGYFDRKYGLRGLLLPPLGLLLGLLLAVVWAGVYLAVGLDPVLYAWAVAAPAVLAFLIGFSQQWLYGAR